MAICCGCDPLRALANRIADRPYSMESVPPPRWADFDLSTMAARELLSPLRARAYSGLRMEVTPRARELYLRALAIAAPGLPVPTDPICEVARAAPCLAGARQWLEAKAGSGAGADILMRACAELATGIPLTHLALAVGRRSGTPILVPGRHWAEVTLSPEGLKAQARWRAREAFGRRLMEIKAQVRQFEEADQGLLREHLGEEGLRAREEEVSRMRSALYDHARLGRLLRERERAAEEAVFLGDDEAQALSQAALDEFAAGLSVRLLSANFLSPTARRGAPNPGFRAAYRQAYAELLPWLPPISEAACEQARKAAASGDPWPLLRPHLPLQRSLMGLCDEYEQRLAPGTQGDATFIFSDVGERAMASLGEATGPGD